MPIRPRLDSVHSGVLPIVALTLVLLSPAGFAKDKVELPKPPADVSAEELGRMQTRTVSAEPKTILQALRSVLAMNGWTVGEFDEQHGILRATSIRSQSGVGPQNDWILEFDEKTRQQLLTKPEKRFYRLSAWTRWVDVAAVVDSWNGESSRIRITILNMGLPPDSTRAKSAYSPFTENTNIVHSHDQSIGAVVQDTNAYTELFEQLNRELTGVRDNLEPSTPR